MKTATIIAMTRTANDSRDTAGSTTGLVGPQRDALAAALEIEIHGAKIDGRDLPSGHGVVIKYASGRLRTIRERDIYDTRSKLSMSQASADALKKFTIATR